jgi:hypothetical protein
MVTTRRVLDGIFQNADDLPVAIDALPVSGASRRFVAKYATVSAGQPVTTLATIGTRAGDLAAAGTSTAPVLRTSGGRTYLEFDGTDDELICTSTDSAAIGAAPFTSYIVARMRAANTNGVYWPLVNHGGGFGITTANTGAALYRGAVTADFATLDTNWHVFYGVFNGASSLAKRDAAAPVTGNAGTAAIVTLSLGTKAASGNATRPPLDIAEMGMFDRALTAAELASLSTQLMATYAIV